MANAARHRDFAPCLGDKAVAGSNAVAGKVGVLRRIFDTIFFESLQKQVDRDATRLLARSGGRLTDDIERQMTERLLTGNWNARQ